MDLNKRKLALINWISQTDDKGVIEAVESVKNSETGKWDELPDSVKKDLEEALSQADKGEFISFEAQLTKHKKYFEK